MVYVEVPKFTVKKELIKLPSKRTALIIVDMQNDFAHPNGKLFVPTAPKTIKPISMLLKKARETKVLVVFTQDTHYLGDPEFNVWGEHALIGTWGHQIIEELKPKIPEEIVVQKNKYDGFFGTPLDSILRSRGIEYLVITGTVANICVLHTSSSAALYGYKTVIPVDTISALTDFDMYATLRQVHFLYKGILTESRYIEFR
ncbi:MAG: cysteine hydrolase [Thermoprotei archaeon]|nr:MAG: cysteine hydrolase [Thermoprotei archaeon]